MYFNQDFCVREEKTTNLLPRCVFTIVFWNEDTSYFEMRIPRDLVALDHGNIILWSVYISVHIIYIYYIYYRGKKWKQYRPMQYVTKWNFFCIEFSKEAVNWTFCIYYFYNQMDVVTCHETCYRINVLSYNVTSSINTKVHIISLFNYSHLTIGSSKYTRQPHTYIIYVKK